MLGACAFVVTLFVLAVSLAMVVRANTLTLIYIGTTIANIGVALVALAALADISRSIGGVEAGTVGTFAGIVVLLFRLLAREAVPDSPVDDHRHRPGVPAVAQAPLEVGGVEGVMVLLRQERIIAGAEVELVAVVVAVEEDRVVNEIWRDVAVAAAYAGAGTAHRALGVVAVAEAASELGVSVVVRLAPEEAHGVAAEDKEVVPLVGDTVHAVGVEL